MTPGLMAQPLPSRADIVCCLLEAGRALHAREVASRCRVPEGSYSRLLELLEQLSFDRTIRRMAGGRFRAPLHDGVGGQAWEGVLAVNPRGFGFVTAAGQEDVYVAPDSIGGALHGDLVRVQIISRTSRGNEGRIQDIVARRDPRVAGVLRKRGRSAWLEPDDARLRGPIVLGSGLAKGKDGEAAVASITRFPDGANENPEGELIAVLGAPGDPKAEVAKILVREQIAEEHPAEAMQEAEALAARTLRETPGERADLRQVPLPTIDPEEARDHDDAIWVEREGEGYRVWVAIADVAEYVTPESALDVEARRRGCTLYLPDRAVPMLPAALSADLCSLLPDHDRLCLCVIADLDAKGTVRRYEVVEGVMRSAAMLTYGGVARALGLSDQPPRSAQAEGLKKGLRVLEELSRKLRKSRMRRGALDLDLPEARVVLDKHTGAPLDVVRLAEDPGVKRAYQIVEEMMLLANELVAQWLSERRSLAIYRVHGAPDEEKLERLSQAAEQLGVPFQVEQLRQPLGLARWHAKLKEHPRRSVLEMLLLRSLKQAVYDIVNIGHFGLASDAYLHFTSPIRRYPDLVVHRLVKNLLRGGKPATSPPDVEKMRSAATAASDRERATVAVEREVVDLYRALAMQDHVGEAYDGTVSAIVSGGMFVTLDHPFVDVFVRFESMGPDRYEATQDELGVVGLRSGEHILLGERVRVEIEDVAALRRMVYGRRVPPSELLRKLGRGRRADGRGRRSSEEQGQQQQRGRGSAAARSNRSNRSQRPAPGRSPSGSRRDRDRASGAPGRGRRGR
ncbi:MAG: VacB/RNase II family 3'-5' exoribonuclease [Polyangiaceae bacterium]|nr:VacB/RNase II family 3'-5' exoribonuclease [Polyangiaceae bacterium]